MMGHAKDFLMDRFSPETKEQKETLHGIEEERGSLLGEVFESILARQFPQLSRLMDLATAGGLKAGDPETYPLQREFETLTALSTLVPNKFLKKITDPLLSQAWFMMLVDYYPLDGNIEEKIMKEHDPQAVIDFLRMVHQDIVTTLEGVN